MDNHEIGKNIVQLRKKHGLSQRELAERAGITHSAISSIENGKVSPSVSSLQKSSMYFLYHCRSFSFLNNLRMMK